MPLWGSLLTWNRTTILSIWCDWVLQSFTVLKDFLRRVLRCFNAALVPLSMAFLLHTSVCPSPKIGMPCAVSWSAVATSCSGGALLIHPHEAIISFSITLSGVCARCSKGGAHCLLTSGVLHLSRLLSLFLGWTCGMWCGWLEVRAIALPGNPLMQTPNYRAFIIQSPCPQSNQKSGELTVASGK